MEIIVAAVLGLVAGGAAMWGWVVYRTTRDREVTERRIEELREEIAMRKEAYEQVLNRRLNGIETEAVARKMLKDIWE